MKPLANLIDRVEPAGLGLQQWIAEATRGEALSQIYRFHVDANAVE
ncbi:MAG TPA: hypothetical protein VGM54_12220 [Chthoniobacter sp.]|jgi:hypothetical protein